MASDDFEDLDITQLSIQGSASGIYRGQKVRRVPAFAEEPEVFLARIFLDSAGGPVAVQVDEHAIAHIAALQIVNGDRIIVTRLTEENFSVAKEAAED
jgi:hypothetical protein